MFDELSRKNVLGITGLDQPQSTRACNKGYLIENRANQHCWMQKMDEWSTVDQRNGKGDTGEMEKEFKEDQMNIWHQGLLERRKTEQ